MTASCAYLHAYYDDDWSRCPPNGGPARLYRLKDGSVQSYCDDGAQQVREDGVQIELLRDQP